MFAEAELSIPLAFPVAEHALACAMANGGLVAESRQAVEDGLVFLMPVGPRGSHGPAKEVLVRLLRGRIVEESFVVPMRWEVRGPTGRLFPSLDANIGLVANGLERSTLSIVGRYEPPLGRLGARADRAGMSRIASATMAALLRELAAQLGRWAST
jgi:hypothetical protein